MALRDKMLKKKDYAVKNGFEVKQKPKRNHVKSKKKKSTPMRMARKIHRSAKRI
jgi:hypothetical protein